MDVNARIKIVNKSEFYKLYNTLLNKYHDYMYTLPKKSMIDLGTAMINKRRTKRNRRKCLWLLSRYPIGLFIHKKTF